LDPEILNVFVNALEAVAKLLDEISPISWPIVIGTFFPIFIVILDVVVWWLRGMALPVPCDYPVTTRKHACRNRAVGEWHRCWRHNKSRRRKTDKHRIRPNLRRWQTVDKQNRVVERQDIHGRGFLRSRSDLIGLFYYRGFARPLGDVVAFAPRVFHDRWEQLKYVAQKIKGKQFHPRDLFTRTPLPGRAGVAERLPDVIMSTRASLILAGAGLASVALALAVREIKDFVNYAATLFFVSAWAVVRNGIWDPDPHWARKALRLTVNWYLKFILVALATLVLARLHERLDI
jgi:hypothetical protein